MIINQDLEMTSQTIITYTALTVGFSALKKELVQPPYIDIKYGDGSCHRFASKLQNTFYANNQIIAIWERGIYIGRVEEKDANLGTKL